MSTSNEWLRLSVSDLKVVKSVVLTDDIRYEVLCLLLQQAVEKSLKAVLVHLGQQPPKTHDINLLIETLLFLIEIPDYINDTVDLTMFSVITRYPGGYDELDDVEEFYRLLHITEMCIEWVKSIII
jgi:HEPN domain-containing protein